MVFINPDKINPSRLFLIAFTALLFSGCTAIRKYQKNKPFVYHNNINLNIDDVTPDEKVIIRSRLNTQLDDSSKVRIKDVAFLVHYIDRPPVFDTNSARASADNMQVSMAYLGYYSAITGYTYSIDSSKKNQQRVTTTYEVNAGKRTLIDTFAYMLDKPELQQLALQTKHESPLQKNAPVTKAAIIQETARLVDLYRNNGYYKFTTEELRVTGDSSIEALTTVPDEPFETLRLLTEATEKRNKPTIRLGMLLNKATDSTRLNKFSIRNVYILPDYTPGDYLSDTSLTENISNGYIIRYHKKLFTNNLLVRNMYVKTGNIYRQEEYYKTINSLYKLGVWESPAIDIIERDTNQLDLVVKLTPIKKYGFEGDIELSYSANSNSSNIISATNSGNLLGISGNLSLLNRNVAKEAIRMTNSIRAGVEFNTSSRNNSGSLINSNEISYSNSILFPKFILFFKGLNNKNFLVKQSYINTNVSLIKRIDFFNQQVFSIAHGYNLTRKANRSNTITPFNFDFRRIYNTSARFENTLDTFPFLRYSFNTALVMGSSYRYVSTYTNPKYPQRSTNFKFNIEESGLLWGRLRDAISKNGNKNFLTNYLKQFLKTDVDYTYTISHPKSAMAFRLFGGVGIPLSKSDTTLPFFKQYFGGGPSSMRGWPVRGIGVGMQPLAPYSSRLFNDRTGDIQLEANAEYRYNIAPLFSNAVFLKGAFFVDAGNIWNFKNTKPDRSLDSTQFKFKNIYKQLGLSAGTGLRLDFSYFLIRFDMGFRFKRPDITENDGWQIPNLTWKNLFYNNPANRKWRYENFNFTIGIDYPF
ncbi:MAG TPA: BamA/TamA family outer membrane protein [Chitinophagaceae bacterium]|nr:BamA/TamA family outer membrane protein [Chitinophagaceae bacterium]